MNPQAGGPPSPEMRETLRAQKEADMQSRIDQHRADNPDMAMENFNEAAQSHNQIEQDANAAGDRAHHINQRLNDKERISGRKLSDLNEQARMEIWGSGNATYTEPRRRAGEEEKRVVASPDNPEAGVLEGIRTNAPDFRSDAVFGKGKKARMEKADEYEAEVLRLVEEEGLELVQAKLYMDLGIEADEQKAVVDAKAKVLAGKLEAQGNDPENARERAIKQFNKELEGTEAEVHSDKRLEIIKNFGKKGVFTKKEYEEAKKEFVEQGGKLSEPAKPDTQTPEPIEPPENENQEATPAEDDTEVLINDVNGGGDDEPPEAPTRRSLRDRFRDFGIRLATGVVHGGGERGDRARRALRYAGVGLVGAAAVVGVNELIDGDNHTHLYEISNIGDQHGSGGANIDTPSMLDTVPSPSDASVGSEHVAATPETFNVEAGNGFTHEIMDYANAHGKDVTPEQAYQIYEHLEAKHGANLIDILGDSDKVNTYTMADGNYGIDAPGKAVWADGVEDTIRHDLGLSEAKDGTTGMGAGTPGEPGGVGAGGQPAPETQDLTDSSGASANEVISVQNGDGDPLAENVALGATGAAVAMGAYHLGRRDRGNNGEGNNTNATTVVRPPQEQGREAGRRDRDLEQRVDELEGRSRELQNALLEQGQFIQFVFSQLSPEGRERIARAWQEELARREQENNQ